MPTAESELNRIILRGARGRAAPARWNAAVRAIRTHLGLEVAYASQFVGETMVLREVDAPGLEQMAHKGAAFPLDAVYCHDILAGRLPELIPDTAAEPIALAKPITAALPIGSHLSVPIRLPDGSVYGMFCCLGFRPNPTLNGRDLQMTKAFAELAAHEIHDQVAQDREAQERQARIQAVIERGGLAIAYQPIWSIQPRRPVGFECLARFTGSPNRPPNQWFAEAAKVGRGAALEIAAIRLALQALVDLPPDIYLAVNASPVTVMAQGFEEAFAGLPPRRIVLEVTEHASVSSYDGLVERLEGLRGRGMRLAVDDAGAGYSGLHHILKLRPDLIKLDMALTRDIDSDPARQALAAALVAFAHDTDSRIIAEGVETAAELEMLHALGVERAQGYFLGRPVPAAQMQSMFPAPARAGLLPA
ncbi:sensor domain-containing phosphodiesterase [Roseomonas rosulenta]|uniref:sensor domain-containing phosphodiesterase n=1 Tax=Roseomonas rosulenta TaxID=2748667 RepID=UPI0018DF0A97|nr:EAL domain-containing protein [Roseomonas rosulenta]